MRSDQEEKMYELVNTAFKEIALCLGGIFITYKTSDKVIHQIANSIEDIYYKTMGALEQTLGRGVFFDTRKRESRPHPHPAIESLLNALNFKPVRRRCK